jgi:hypothetical protein
MSMFKSRPIHTEFSIVDPEHKPYAELGYVLHTDRQLSSTATCRMDELIVLVLCEYNLDNGDYYDVREPLFEFMHDMLKATFLELENDGTIVFVSFMCALYNEKVVSGVREIRNSILKKEAPEQTMENVTEAFRSAFHGKLKLLSNALELT